MFALDPLIVGRWNGHSLWVQFNDAGRFTYRVEFCRQKAEGDAERWVALDGGVTRRNWLVVPIWQAGIRVQVRVKVNGWDMDWAMAEEATFQKSTCNFGFRAGPKPLDLAKGTMFHSVVDGAACGYSLDEDVHVEPGEHAYAPMTALLSSGFCQLDREYHFDLEPGNGVRIWNSAESQNDLARTGRAFTIMESMPMDGPMALIKRQPRNPVVR